MEDNAYIGIPIHSHRIALVLSFQFLLILQKSLQHDDSSVYPLLLLFQLITGTRIGECRGLTWKDIDLDCRVAVFNKQTANGIQFDVDKKKTTYIGKNDVDHIKGYEQGREIGLSDDAISILQQVMELHLDNTKVFPIRYGTYNSKVKLAAEYANCDPKLFHTHSLRVTRGTDIYNKCGDIAITQVILGHTTPQMTRKYIKDHEIKAKARELMMKNNYSTPAQPPVSDK